MVIRINKWDDEKHKNILLSRYELKNSDISETFKILDYMKKNEILLKIFNEDATVDSDKYEEYVIEEVSMMFDTNNEEGIIPFISVDCK